MTPITIAQNRFGLGARPGDSPPKTSAERPAAWLLNQLGRYDPRPTEIANQPSAVDAIDKYNTVRDLRRQARQSGNTDQNAEQIKSIRQGVRATYARNVAARGMQAIETDAPFAERMVHFWSNHFAVSIQKNQIRDLAGAHEFEAIRPHIMGKFGDMLKAAVLHPAMLLYLDQPRSSGPNSRIATRANVRTGRNLGLNENLAREILELHTLGVQGGYTQSDVTEFAKAMTGWTLAGMPRARRAIVLENGLAWAGFQHEPGARTIMGKTYRQTGQDQSLAVLDTIATHPSTAKHVATKLARHFAGDTPPPAMIARLQAAFLETGGDLPSIYRAIVDSPEAWVPEPIKFRTPWEWSIAALRIAGTGATNPRQFTRMQTELGQTVWGPPSPQGYPDIASSWAAPDALVRRIEVAAQISRAASGDYDVSAVARSLFNDSLNDDTATWIARAESPRQGFALLLSSPEMMRR